MRHPGSATRSPAPEKGRSVRAAPPLLSYTQSHEVRLVTQVPGSRHCAPGSALCGPGAMLLWLQERNGPPWACWGSPGGWLEGPRRCLRCADCEGLYQPIEAHGRLPLRS